MFVFQKIWRALFSCSTRFEIRLFALLPMNSEPLEHLTLSFSWKYLTLKSRLLFSQKDPSKMFGWVLNMPLKCRIWIPIFVAGAQTTRNMLMAAIRRSHSWKNHTRLTLGKSLWRHQSNIPTVKIQQIAWTQPTLTCSKSTIETVEKGEK